MNTNNPEKVLKTTKTQNQDNHFPEQDLKSELSKQTARAQQLYREATDLQPLIS